MPIADYAHWNEEAPRIWWEEEGRHLESPDDDFDSPEMNAADAFAEELSEWYDDEVLDHLADEAWKASWPKAWRMVEWEARDRGLIP